MAVISEAQNYQDYMIPHTWATEEETQPQITPEAQNIDGLVVEPTKPTVMEMITRLHFHPLD